MKTYNQKPAEVTRTWVILDAAEAPLGRIATTAAKYLIGKHKPTYTAHVDGGDSVIVINAAKSVVTGAKESSKEYHNYSGFPGGLKTKKLKDVRESNPNRIITDAVQGMLPKNKLLDGRMKRLKVYADEQHGHEAQKPVKIGVK
ncbi:MAG: 50S ribosomal protein L13 [Candidatus Woesebacteria bacterium]|jgi:large subunit ribosomal protein L13